MVHTYVYCSVMDDGRLYVRWSKWNHETNQRVVREFIVTMPKKETQP